MARPAALSLLAALVLLACGACALSSAHESIRAWPSPIPVLQTRADIATVLEQEKMIVGAELGVLSGAFAKEMLTKWPSAMQYVLVDLWAQQENYLDMTNGDAAAQDVRLNEAKVNIAPWAGKVQICRNFTTACATQFPAGHFDFVYVDARHDRKGVLEDLEAWWPLVRPDGLVCGHDFVTQDEGPQQSGQDWTKSADGTVDTSRRVSRGAVEDFARRHRRQIQVTYRQPDWPSWCIRR
jgi:hypothetical protein